MAAKIRNRLCRQLMSAVNSRAIIHNDRKIPSCLETVCTRRSFSNEPFDFNAIIRSNREGSSMDGVKRSMSKKVSQIGNKPTKTETDASPTTDKTDAPEDDVTAEIPDWFTVLMDASYTGDAVLDDEKFKQFYDFVEDLELKAIPSVGAILNQTQPKAQVATLERWKKAKTKELGGKEEFEKYSKKTLNRGVSFHKTIEKYLLGETDFEIADTAKVYLESGLDVLKQVEDVKLVEENVAHSEMLYTGKIDCVASYRGSPCLIEWKTSSVYKPNLSNTYDNPMQLVAYLGALNKSTKLQRMNLPPITNALLVICYKDGEPATVHTMSPKVCQKYWARWQERVYKFWTTCYLQKLQSQ